MVRRSNRLKSASPSATDFDDSSDDEEVSEEEDSVDPPETKDKEAAVQKPKAKSTKRVPPHIEKQLLQDIEKSGGLDKLSGQALSKLLNQRKCYGNRGDDLRRRITTRVNYLKQIDRVKYLSLLSRLGLFDIVFEFGSKNYPTDIVQVPTDIVQVPTALSSKKRKNTVTHPTTIATVTPAAAAKEEAPSIANSPQPLIKKSKTLTPAIPSSTPVRVIKPTSTMTGTIIVLASEKYPSLPSQYRGCKASKSLTARYKLAPTL